MDMITAPEWRTSSYSSGNGGNCVQIAANLPGVVAIQDSKNPGPALAVAPASFAAFAAAIKNGDFDR